MSSATSLGCETIAQRVGAIYIRERLKGERISISASTPVMTRNRSRCVLRRLTSGAVPPPRSSINVTGSAAFVAAIAIETLVTPPHTTARLGQPAST
jgi:hypothetical protein